MVDKRKETGQEGGLGGGLKNHLGSVPESSGSRSHTHRHREAETPSGKSFIMFVKRICQFGLLFAWIFFLFHALSFWHTGWLVGPGQTDDDGPAGKLFTYSLGEIQSDRQLASQHQWKAVFFRQIASQKHGR